MSQNHTNQIEFKPAWWLPGPHLQTLWPTFCRRSVHNTLRRERFELPDGDFVDLDWVGEGNGPIVLLLHGLEGSVQSAYAQGMLHAIQQRGWRGVLMHFRGCSGEMNRHIRSYHSGDTKDVATVVNTLREREQQTPLAAIGYSLGGNVLLKWLGELGQKTQLKAAVAVSVPFELHKASNRIKQGFSRLYQWHFLRLLRKKMRAKFQYLPTPFVFPKFKTLRSIHEFDDKVTAPLHGFTNADEYYAKSSCRQFLSTISIPTLLLQAIDDPFLVEDLLPESHELSPTTTLEITSGGGHVGFVSGSVPWRAQYWLEQRIPLFLEEHLL